MSEELFLSCVLGILVGGIAWIPIGLIVSNLIMGWQERKDTVERQRRYDEAVAEVKAGKRG